MEVNYVKMSNHFFCRFLVFSINKKTKIMFLKEKYIRTFFFSQQIGTQMKKR